MADGALDIDADPRLDKRQVCERIAVRTRFFDDFFIEAASFQRPGDAALWLDVADVDIAGGVTATLN